MTSGNHWHRSGLDAAEPWQGEWEKNVRVECAGGAGEGKGEEEVEVGEFVFHIQLSAVECLWSGFSDWTSCSSSCGEGFQKRKRKVLQPAQNEGQACAGQAEEERTCQSEPCLGESGKLFQSLIICSPSQCLVLGQCLVPGVSVHNLVGREYRLGKDKLQEKRLAEAKLVTEWGKKLKNV